MTPVLSIIIPTKNEEKVLEATLVQFKTLGIQHEVIVTDGGSTDRTIEIARQLADQVVVHQGPERQNIAGGRNAGAKVARGEFFLFFDADCGIRAVNPFFLVALAAFDDPRVVGICPRIIVWPEMRTWGDLLSFGLANTYGWLVNNVLGIGGAMGEFQLVRAQTFRKIGGYNEKMTAAEDQDFFIRLAREGRTRQVRSLCVYHTGRRAHKIGWARLWWEWMTNGASMVFTGRSVSSEWKVIR